jgi:hypothetical protein
MTTSLADVHAQLTATQRHGYAVYAGDTLIGWGITKLAGAAIVGATHLVNVQNGGIIHL